MKADVIKIMAMHINKTAFAIGQKVTDDSIETMADLTVDMIIQKKIYGLSELTDDRIRIVFECAISDVYGECKKVYPKAIINWFQSQKKYEKSKQDLEIKENNYNISDEEAKANGMRWGEYIKWRLQNGVDPDDVSIELYYTAKNGGNLRELENEFKGRLGNNLIKRI